jgi:hypothetical protein
MLLMVCWGVGLWGMQRWGWQWVECGRIPGVKEGVRIGLDWIPECFIFLWCWRNRGGYGELDMEWVGFSWHLPGTPHSTCPAGLVEKASFFHFRG